MSARDRCARFADGSYKVNYYDELRACAAVIEESGLAQKLGGMHPPQGVSPWLQNGAEDKVWVLVLKNGDTNGSEALVWIYKKQKLEEIANPLNISATYHLGWVNGRIKWRNPWTGARVGEDSTEIVALNAVGVKAKLDEVKHDRPLVGSENGQGDGPHETEDILLWITKAPEQ